MNSRKIPLENLNGKSKIRFYTNNNSVNFAHNPIHVFVCFDNNSKEEFYSNTKTITSGQTQLTGFDVDIKNGAKSAEIIITKHNSDLDLGLIVVDAA